MPWFDAVDAYCERLGPGLWAEPLNAVTNLAFLGGAWIMWRRAGDDRMGRSLAAVLAVIGVGSGLFHTFANGLTSLMDVLPILGFILLYLFAASRDMLGLRPVWALAATAAFLPYTAATVPLWSKVPGLGSSAGYMPVPVLILFYAWLLRTRSPKAAQGLVIGAGVLLVSLLARTVDQPLCGGWPTGTHFLWHLLNAGMLAWMILVYLRFREEVSRKPR